MIINKKNNSQPQTQHQPHSQTKTSFPPPDHSPHLNSKTRYPPPAKSLKYVSLTPYRDSQLAKKKKSSVPPNTKNTSRSPSNPTKNNLNFNTSHPNATVYLTYPPSSPVEFTKLKNYK